MRVPAVLAGFAVVVGGAVLIATAGRVLVPAEPAVASTADDGDPRPAGPDNLLRLAPENEPASEPGHGGPVRPVAPGVIAPPEFDPAALQREAPRRPLSELSLALPPRTAPEDNWDGTILYRPVVTASARFEAMGYDVSIAGVDSVDPSETCTHDGTDWLCGARARTAFRYWLRGRALSCAMPDAGEKAIVAGCRLGKQDAGAWLVSHGWARATPGGPYAEAGKQAREKELGIFGPPPLSIN
jgi:endonuclease YncB( thermonuclease family)